MMSGIIMLIGMTCVTGVFLLFNYYHEQDRAKKLQDTASMGANAAHRK